MGFLKNILTKAKNFFTGEKAVAEKAVVTAGPSIAAPRAPLVNKQYSNSQLLNRLQSHLLFNGVMATIQRDYKKSTDGMNRAAQARYRTALAANPRFRVLRVKEVADG